MLCLLVCMAMQDGMAQFMCQGKTAQRFGQAATEPDQIFLWLQPAVGSLWSVVLVKGCDLQAMPGYKFIYRCLIILPLRVFRFETLQQLACRRYCLIMHPVIHDASY